MEQLPFGNLTKPRLRLHEALFMFSLAWNILLMPFIYNLIHIAVYKAIHSEMRKTEVGVSLNSSSSSSNSSNSIMNISSRFCTMDS